MKTLAALMVGLFATSACAGSSRDGSNPEQQVTPSKESACPETARPVDCQLACAGYDAVMSERAKDPGFAGDRLSKEQCLEQCAAPPGPEFLVSLACFAKPGVNVASYDECEKRCTASHTSPMPSG